MKYTKEKVEDVEVITRMKKDNIPQWIVPPAWMVDVDHSNLGSCKGGALRWPTCRL